jgi:Flp pilus assembly pilin Flp
MLSKINQLLRPVWVRFHDEKGQAMPEYGLLVALIALVVVLGATAIGLAVTGTLDDVASGITGAGS